MKKRIPAITAIILTAAAVLTGCGSSVPEMTEEQSAQITEYAAGLLLKYDEGYDSRLIDTDEINEAESQKDPAPVPEEGDVLSDQETQNAEQEKAEDAAVTTDGTAAEESAAAAEQADLEEAAPVEDRSIEEFYGIDGIRFQYTGYELQTVYSGEEPQDGTDPRNLSFAMTASRGCRLLILKFDAVNDGTQDRDLNMLSANAKFKISINGEAPRYALTTMLTNDLSSFVGTVEAGTSIPLVLVGEIQEELADSIQTLSLNMRNVSEDATTLLN